MKTDQAPIRPYSRRDGFGTMNAAQRGAESDRILETYYKINSQKSVRDITKICTKLHQISGAHIRISARGQIISRQNQLKSAEIGLFLA